MKAKKLVSLALVTTMMATVAGCGGLGSATDKNSGSTDTKQAAADEKPSAISTQGKTNDIVIKVSNGSADTAPFVRAQIDTFLPAVEEKTDGKAGVEVYASGQLGDDTTTTEAVIAGQLECTNTSTAPLVSYVPELAIFDIPFLFDSEEQADYILDNTEVGEYLNKKLEEKGIINLAWNENGFRQLTNSKVAVQNVADLKGLKIRTMENEFHIELWNSLGATSVPMGASELYTALQQGTVDGEENPIPNMFAYRFQEVQKYITKTNHIYSPFVMAFSKKIWDTYDEDTQNAIREAALEYAKVERENNRAEAETDLKLCETDYDCEVTELSEESKQEFKDATAHIRDMVAEDAGTEIMDLLDKAVAEYEAQK